jgi:hypothetical protein
MGDAWSREHASVRERINSALQPNTRAAACATIDHSRRGIPLARSAARLWTDPFMADAGWVVDELISVTAQVASPLAD